MYKKITSKYNSELDKTARVIARELNLFLPTARLIVARGYDTPQKAADFLTVSSEKPQDPFLFPDMKSAAERVLRAVRNGEFITVYGDYDVDGVTATAIMTLYLRSIGAARVDYLIPTRDGDGYGLSRGGIAEVKRRGSTLIITVDTGSSAAEEIALAAEYGIDVVITDHHETGGTLPTAAAFVNPKRNAAEDCPYMREIAGAAVALKTVAAIEMTLRPDADKSEVFDSVMARYGALAALGTIADVMPLVGENRYIVAGGIESANLSSCVSSVGIAALCDAALGTVDKFGNKKPRRKLNSGAVSFALAPRLNAAGRMDSADIALELFLTNNKSEAEEISAKLCALNTARQTEEREICAKVVEWLENDGNIDKRSVIIAYGDGWRHGIMGIVASKITEKYRKPAIILAVEEDENGLRVARGSGRSVPLVRKDGGGVLNLVDALRECGDLTIRFGGHEGAVGLAVEESKIAEFTERIDRYVSENFAPEPSDDALVECDLEITLRDITLQQIEQINRLGPFGNGNPEPLFCMRGLRVGSAAAVGGGAHTKYILCEPGVVNGFSTTAMYFFHKPADDDFMAGEIVNAAFRLDVSDFNGVRSAQLTVQAISSAVEKSTREIAEEFIPTRAEFAALYRALVQGQTGGGSRGNIDRLCEITNLQLPKLRLALDVLKERGVITLEYDWKAREISYTLPPQTEKVTLEDSPLIKRK